MVPEEGVEDGGRGFRAQETEPEVGPRRVGVRPDVEEMLTTFSRTGFFHSSVIIAMIVSTPSIPAWKKFANREIGREVLRVSKPLSWIPRSRQARSRTLAAAAAG